MGHIRLLLKVPKSYLNGWVFFSFSPEPKNTPEMPQTCLHFLIEEKACFIIQFEQCACDPVSNHST